MKKILLLADIHQQNYVLKNLKHFLEKQKFDALIFAGDLTNRTKDALGYAKRFEKIIEDSGLEIFFIHGNNESKDVVEYFSKKGYSIHLKPKSFYGFTIVGIGGFGDDYTNSFDIKNSILVTHYPPVLSDKKFKDAPLLHIFGHSHFWEYQKNKVDTLLIQLKTAMFNRAAILEIPSLKVKFVSFK